MKIREFVIALAIRESKMLFQRRVVNRCRKTVIYFPIRFGALSKQLCATSTLVYDRFVYVKEACSLY